MKHITCYLDFISPFAWLAFDALPDALQFPVSTVSLPVFASLLIILASSLVVIALFRRRG